MRNIEQQFVDDLYNPELSGINILKKCIKEQELEKINAFIRNNQHTFQEKREKYIENNQLVSLLYRGPFDNIDLAETVFSQLLNIYKNIRQNIENKSSIKFSKGTSLEAKLIYYPISELGVGIHKDLSSNINIILFFNLEGNADIKTFSNKKGDNPISHLIEPGDISVMRAPRNLDEPDIRPYHAVQKVFEPRTVMVIREINEDMEKLTNKDNWRGF